MGNLYYYDDGIFKNYSSSIKWYEKSAKQGFSTAMVKLGDIYYRGTGVDKDYKKAINYFLTALKTGYFDPEGHVNLNLGIMYQNGEGSKIDNSQAFKYCSEAYKKNSSLSWVIGSLYQDGIGVEKNAKEAVKYFKYAVEKEIPEGEFFLALCYLSGTGVNKDSKEFKRLIESAASKGHRPAIEFIEKANKLTSSRQTTSTSTSNRQNNINKVVDLNTFQGTFASTPSGNLWVKISIQGTNVRIWTGIPSGGSWGDAQMCNLKEINGSLRLVEERDYNTGRKNYYVYTSGCDYTFFISYIPDSYSKYYYSMEQSSRLPLKRVNLNYNPWD